MGRLDKSLKKRPGGVKMGLLCVAAILVIAVGIVFVSPLAPTETSTVYGAPCELGEAPEYDSNNQLVEGSCEPPPLDDCDPQLGQCSGETEDVDLIEKYLNPTINFLAIIVGLVVTISIVAGGIQYSSAGDNPQATAKAKSRIVEALLGLLAFLLLYLGLQWIMPGGFF